MKKYISLSLALIFSLCFLMFGVNADSPNIIDNADLLSEDEEIALAKEIDPVKSRYDFEIVILTESSIYGEDPEAYADDYFDYNGYGENGVLFLVDMGERNWHISTSGTATDVIGENELDYFEYEIIPYLSNGDYYNCFSEFIGSVEEMVNLDANGEEFFDYYYDTENDFFDESTYTAGYESSQSFNIPKNILIALVVGFGIAFVVVLTMKGKLKTVRAKLTAENYVVPGSMNVTRSRELFLYRHVTRTPRQQNNASKGGRAGGGVHIGSSGRSHGGRGGSF